VKESDRIATMATNLRLLGVEVEERRTAWPFTAARCSSPLAPVRSYGDHRIAMAMAVLATYATESRW
jgi:3-phosphoshikimate 1-carboxyvinyltransferase